MIGTADNSAPRLLSDSPLQRSGIFSLVTAIVGPPIYVLCELKNWPLFTYHPGPNHLDWLYAPPVRDWGPAMYWYGWTASAMISAAIIGWLASMLPARVVERIPRSLGWAVAIATIPLLVYGLKFYWRW